MAMMKASSLVLTLLVLTLLSILSRAVSSESSSPYYEFLKKLQGSHKKGDQVQGLHKLKLYLHRFGYLEYYNNYTNNQSHGYDDTFDELLASAIQTYQLNYNLNVTGELDAETVSEMMSSRCGVADVINGTTRMLSGRLQKLAQLSENEVSHYHSFFMEKPKWPRTKYHLTYTFLASTPDMAKVPVQRAFQRWASVSRFSFSAFEGAGTRKKPDITVSFERGFHGDGQPFDGPGAVLAHAFAPTDGRFHYDGDEQWAVGANKEGFFDLETVALHSIGHLLGLSHSSVRASVMFPNFHGGETKDLHQDDIDELKFLYGF